MNTHPESENRVLRKNSPLFWCTLLIPVALIPLGINFLLNPVGASTAYGIAIHDPAAFPYMWVKGIRDIFAALVMLPFLFRGDRRAIATIFSVSILVPVGDGLIILHQLGVSPPLYVHWGTSLYMIIVAVFLVRGNGVRSLSSSREADMRISRNRCQRA